MIALVFVLLVACGAVLIVARSAGKRASQPRSRISLSQPLEGANAVASLDHESGEESTLDVAGSGRENSNGSDEEMVGVPSDVTLEMADSDRERETFTQLALGSDTGLEITEEPPLPRAEASRAEEPEGQDAPQIVTGLLFLPPLPSAVRHVEPSPEQPAVDVEEAHDHEPTVEEREWIANAVANCAAETPILLEFYQHYAMWRVAIRTEIADLKPPRAAALCAGLIGYGRDEQLLAVDWAIANDDSVVARQAIAESFAQGDVEVLAFAAQALYARGVDPEKYLLDIGVEPAIVQAATRSLHAMIGVS